MPRLAGQGTEESFARPGLNLTLIRQARKDNKPRYLPNWLRQRVEGGSSKGYWRVAGSKVLQVSLPNSYWDRLDLKTLSQTWQRLNRTA
jgi:hypothetical protein